MMSFTSNYQSISVHDDSLYCQNRKVFLKWLPHEQWHCHDAAHNAKGSGPTHSISFRHFTGYPEWQCQDAAHNAKESEATHSITFRHATVYPDSAAVVKEGGVGWDLPSPRVAAQALVALSGLVFCR